MWVQREAQLIGRSPSVDKPKLRRDRNPKHSKQAAESKAEQCENQDPLPLEWVHDEASASTGTKHRDTV